MDFKPIKSNDSHIINFRLKNEGDKAIKDIGVYYKFCSEPNLKKIELNFLNLDAGDIMDISFITQENINLNCDYKTAKTPVSVYRNKTNCFLKPQLDYSEI